MNKAIFTAALPGVPTFSFTASASAEGMVPFGPEFGGWLFGLWAIPGIVFAIIGGRLAENARIGAYLGLHAIVIVPIIFASIDLLPQEV